MRTSVSQLPGRVSVTDSHHGDHHDLGYAVHDGLYAQYEPQYGHYDPNVTGSVFEDSGGMVTPLPGSLGSPGPHQPPHQAPRAVFDEDEQEPPPQAASNMFLNRQQPDTLTGWFDFFFLLFLSLLLLSGMKCSLRLIIHFWRRTWD